MTPEERREAAAAFLEDLARDDSHGYDQAQRWGERGDYDCSSAVITAWERAGVPVKAAGASYTGNMRGAFLRCGFAGVTGGVELNGGRGLLRGGRGGRRGFGALLCRRAGRVLLFGLYSLNHAGFPHSGLLRGPFVHGLRSDGGRVLSGR